MFSLIIFLQAAEGEEEVVKESLIGILFGTGPLGIGISAILIVLSILAVSIFLERFFTIKSAAKIDQNFMNNIKASVAAGNIQGAIALCKNKPTPISRMVEKGLMRIGKPLKDIDAAIENVGNLEIFKLENRLSTLASIAGAAPMIGFFGTVTGMILAFQKMATEQNVTPDVLAGGIFQALITTAFGLLVGIVAFVGYNFLVARVEKVIFNMEKTTVEFMDLLQDPS